MRSFESADIDLIQYTNGELMKDEPNFWRRSLVEAGGSAVVPASGAWFSRRKSPQVFRVVQIGKNTAYA